MYKRQRTSPPNLRSLEELQLNSDEIKTYYNNSFLFCDTGPGLIRIVLFVTMENIEYLSMSSMWLAYGTFKTVPHSFANCIQFIASLKDQILS